MGEYSFSTMIAVMHPIAEGTPSGQSFVLSSGSFPMPPNMSGGGKFEIVRGLKPANTFACQACVGLDISSCRAALIYMSSELQWTPVALLQLRCDSFLITSSSVVVN
jgi:hypothetical protein